MMITGDAEAPILAGGQVPEIGALTVPGGSYGQASCHRSVFTYRPIVSTVNIPRHSPHCKSEQTNRPNTEGQILHA
jgi:hypothetical protein